MMTNNKITSTLLRLFPTDSLHVVGGAVRDRLLKRPFFDLDITVPKGAKNKADRMAATLNGRAFCLDEAFGTYRVTMPLEEPLRHIDISNYQGPTLEADLDRRDFTLNALAVPIAKWGEKNWKKFVIDRHLGQQDLDKMQLRVVSKNVFKDDPLRLLRLVRLSAELNATVDARTLKIAMAERTRLKKAAGERVREEFLKIFQTQSAYQALCLMEKVGLLEVLLPEVKAMRKTGHDYYGKGGVLKHTLDGLRHLEDIAAHLPLWFGRHAKKIRLHLEEDKNGFPRLAHLKWAILLHDFGKPKTAAMKDGRLRFFEHEHVGANHVKKLADRFRWSNDETNRYERIVRHHMRPGNLAMHPEAKEKAAFRFFRDLGDDAIGQLIVSLADHRTYLTKKELLKRATPHEKTTVRLINLYYGRKETVCPPRLINGHDVMKILGIPPSKVVGQLLNEVQEAQVSHHVKTKEDAITFLKTRWTELEKTTPHAPKIS